MRNIIEEIKEGFEYKDELTIVTTIGATISVVLSIVGIALVISMFF